MAAAKSGGGSRDVRASHWPARDPYRPQVSVGIVACLGFLLAHVVGYSAWYIHGLHSRSPAEAFFDGLGTHGRRVSTESAEAQRYFDQGLAFLYGFNHEEAAASFEAAAVCDPQCPMAYWGLAMAYAPSINDPLVPRARAEAAWSAVTKAQQLSARAGPVETALIAAVAQRWSALPSADRRPLDEAYAAAMNGVYQQFPGDPDVGALTAEALLDLRPWDQWTADGKPQPGTERIVAILQAVLRRSPQHPLALHLLIHAVEASPHPELASEAADRLRDLAPAISHLVHMPSHIDVRLGHWHQAVAANEQAIAADREHRRIVGRSQFFSRSEVHNHHMLVFACLMQGSSAKATAALDEMLAIPLENSVKPEPAAIDGLLALPYELHVRFGRWEAMLAEPELDEEYPIARAMWRFGRAVAQAAQKHVHVAKLEQDKFQSALAAVPKNAVFFSCSAGQFLAVAEKVLAAEILYREDNIDAAIEAFREAVRVEDALRYAEPPTWMVPTRHAFGAALLDAGRPSEAEAVYREDLKRYPKNGWSLYGLSRSLKMQGKTAEAAAVMIRFQKAWQYADFKISSSCCCLPGQ